jgi:AcrR family transcriptional regulator
MKKKPKRRENRQPLGRPRAFDVDRALEAALRVFWEKGYEGTAISDLTAAMAINRPSIYATFGNKEALFRKALDRYCSRAAKYLSEAMGEPTARAVAQRLLSEAANVLTSSRNPGGCLLVQGALACGNDAQPIKKELISRRAEAQSMLRKRFERALKDCDLPSDASPSHLARYVLAVTYGMAVHAAGGASRASLQNVIDLSLQAWPE